VIVTVRSFVNSDPGAGTKKYQEPASTGSEILQYLAAIKWLCHLIGRNLSLSKNLVGVLSVVVVVAVGLGFAPARALAAKVDCTKVMSELDSGKKAKDVAQDLKISTSSVYRCKKKAGATAKSGTKTTASAATSSPTAPHKNH
jgi:hypothetical protein